MRVIILPVLLLLVGVALSTAQDLKPFDRLSKKYMPLSAQIGSSGAALKGQGTMGSASTTKDYSAAKEVIIRIPMSKNTDGLLVEAYGAYKNYDTKKVRYEKLNVEKVTGGEYRFILSADKTIERVKVKGTYIDDNGNSSPTVIDTGRAVNHGEKILGWFARAILQNEIVGVIGSSSDLEAAAGTPKPTPDGR